jgi:2-oxoglutarate dehydrogenase E1 component
VERFLEQAVDINMRVASPTTAAQYFHLLRRQALLLRIDPLPLVVLTPKSLLRQPMVASTLRELSEGRWRPVIDDAQARADPEQVRRLICTSGKTFVDLTTSKHRDGAPWVAIARVEQLYPFPVEELRAVVSGYPRLKEVIWLQEEPENMGAWRSVAASIESAVEGRAPVYYLGRHGSASPAEGSSSWYKINQARLVEQAFTIEAGTTVSAAGAVEKAIVWRKVT